MSGMDTDLRRDIIQRLVDEFDLKPNHKGEWLREGRCPQCGKKDLYAKVQAARDWHRINGTN